MTHHPITGDQRRWLQGELTAWQAEQLISADQAERILARYETAADAGRRKQSQAVFTLLGLAALLVGLAVLLLIGYNWDLLPRAAKLAVILTVLAGVHGAGFYLRFRRQARLASEIVFFLGCLLFGGGIWLVAQVFHLDAHYPDGVWWWAVGVLPFALCLDTLLLHALLVGLLATWAGMEVFGFGHVPWLGLPNGAYSLPLLALPGMLWAYRQQSRATLALYVPLLAWWAVLQPFAWQLGWYSAFWIGGVAALLLILAEAHRPESQMGLPYRFGGVLLVGGLLPVLSYAEFWQNVNGSWQEAVLATLLWVPLAGALALAYFVQVRSGRLEPGPRGAAEFLRRQWFPIALSVFLSLTAWWSVVFHNDAVSWLVPTVLCNAVMLALAVWLIGAGIREERMRPFAAGVVYFLLWAVLRYTDLMGDLGMLGAAGLFFLCGVGLAALAVFWGRVRRARPEAPATATPTPPAAATPAWLDGPARWVGKWQRPILLATAAGQAVLLLAMIGIEVLPLACGRTVKLQVVPVDPRDLFRGDYVVLGYDAGRVPPEGIEGAPATAAGTLDYAALEGQPVYVVLEPDADGVYWHATKATLRRPAAGTYLQGRYEGGRLRFGIEAYFVQEGTGRELEQARNARHLAAEVAVAPWGQAALRRVYVEP